MPPTQHPRNDSGISYEPVTGESTWDGARPRSEDDTLDCSPDYLDESDEGKTPSFFERCSRNIGHPVFLFGTGFVLHLVLIGVHISLMAVRYKGFERRVVFPLGTTTNRLSVILPAAAQIVWASYLTILLCVTQLLALHKTFTTSQLLTAIHDDISAWSGLGSALLGLLRQFSLPASFSGILCVTLYLISTHILSITSPILITLVSTNITVIREEMVLHAFPNEDALEDSFARVDSMSAGLLPILGRSTMFTTPGLEGNIIYDVPVHDGATGVVAVNLVVVDVQCGSIHGAKQIGRKSDHSWTIGANYSGGSFMFDLDDLKEYDVNSLNLSTYPYDTPNHKFGSNPYSNPYSFSFSSNVFWSFVNITDDLNSNGSYVPLSPSFPIWDEGSGGSQVSALGRGIQVIGCTTSIREQKGSFDANAKQLISPPRYQCNSSWVPWEPESASGFGGPEPMWMWNTLSENMGSLMARGITTPTFILEYLKEKCGLPLTVWDASWANAHAPALVNLQNFQHALANATAAVLWTAPRIADVAFFSNSSLAQTTDVVPGLRLNINPVPLITGLSACCILTILFWILTPIKPYDRNMVDGTGMLQALWLFADSAAQQRIAKIPEEKMTLHNLRKAGMFKVLASGTAKHGGRNVGQRAVMEGVENETK